MKKSFIVSIILLLCASMGSVDAQQLKMIPADKGQVLEKLPTVQQQLQRHAGMSKVQRTNAGSWAYYEDFEESVIDNPSYSLPEGWVSVATPNDESDVWLAGGLVDYRTNTSVRGADSGIGMAVLMGNDKHDQDAWAFTPKFKLEAGKEYRIRYYVQFYGGNGKECLKGWLGTEQNATSMTTLMYEDTIAPSWTRREYTITPETTGEYCLGFEGASSQGAVAILLDYVTVVSGPVFYGDETIVFPATTTLEAPQQQTYYIYNIGTSPLEVSLNSATSPEITVEGLPMTVENDSWDSYIKVTLDVNKVGDYVGQLVLNTNNPGQETVVIPVTETVTESYVKKGRWYETFIKGLPEGWSSSNAYFSYNDGVDGSMSLHGGSLSGKMLYTTPFTELGSDPKLSFYYHPMAVDVMNRPLELSTDLVTLYVEISDNGGVTWDTVYTVSPETNPYVEQRDAFTRVDVNLSQYANKTCLVRFNFKDYYEFDWTTFSYTIIEYALDNVELGTKTSQDASVKYLDGERNLRVGEPATMNAMVRNSGTANITGYTVRLVKADGTVVTSVEGPTLAAEEMAQVALTWTPDKAENTTVYAEVVLDGDGDATYNKSDALPIAIAPAEAQKYVVGDLDSATLASEPFWFYDKEAASQSLYYANEIDLVNGNIYGVKFHEYSPNEYISPETQIWIGETDKTDFSDGQMVDVGSLTPVHVSSIYLPQTEKGEVAVAFDKPYAYKGGNLVVYVYRSANHFLMNRYAYVHSDDVSRTIAYRTDETGAIAPEDPSAAGLVANTYNEFPVAEFLIDVPDAGTLYGTVTDADGKPIEGATVTIAGTQLTKKTDSEGNYSFATVGAGTYTVEVTCHTYNDASAEVTVKGDSVRQDFVMTKITTYAVSGVVTDAQDGQTVSGAIVRLMGYDNFIGTTDAQGKYEISGVYGGEGYTYKVAVTAPYYKPLTTATVAVTGNVTASYALNEQNYPVRNAEATVSSAIAEVSWTKPLPEYRYDAGVPNGSQRGFTYVNNYATAVLGASYRHAATIRDIEWYLTENGGPHDQINIVIFDLNEQGEPSYNVTYSTTANSVDGKWNIYTLPEPVEVPYGFCVSLSYSSGFLGLSESNPTEEYPALTRGYYYNSDYTYEYTDNDGNRLIDWHDCATFMENHLMLRAVGEGYGMLDNEFSSTSIDGSEVAMAQSRQLVDEVEPVSYTIYRFVPGQGQDEWVLVADGVKSLNYTDEAFSTLPEGEYQYAIVANYLNGSSDYRLTDVVYASSTAVIETLDDANGLTDGRVYTVDGRLVSTNGIEGLEPGVYVTNGKKIAIVK